MSKSNVVSLSIPREETMVDKVSKILTEREVDTLVLFGIDKDARPFVIHSPHKTVPNLVVYLETIKQLLIDEIVTIDVDSIYLEEELTDE